MCSITGKITAGGPAPDVRLIERMCDLMGHRGPDGRGHYRYPRSGGPAGVRLAIGHNRLSIIDLERGGQPLSNEDHTVWVALNGEIYNFVELRARLERLGHAFATGSDAEVIVHGYEVWGEEVIAQLNGMFAFALFDEREEALLLVRDRLGVKPLFYAETANGLVFASEVKALLADPDVADDLDPTALVEYATFNFVMSPRTPLKHVHQLPPATVLRWQRGQVRLREYWDLDLEATGPHREADATTALRHTLHDAVRRRLRSDVRLGALLSGGIDSSAVVSLMASTLGPTFPVFTADFPETSYSELPYASEVARRYGLEHRTVEIAADVENLIERLVWFNDTPLGDSSTVPTYLLAEFARRDVTVVLSGDGGDEGFFGYDTYRADRLFTMYRRLPRRVRQSMIPAVVERLPVSFDKVSLDFKLRQFVAAGLADPLEAHCSWRRIFAADELPRVFHRDVLDAAGAFSPFETPRAYFERHPRADTLTRLLYVDLRTWLADNVLVKVDRASMAHALEVRSPFLDVDVIELAFSLPRALKLRGLGTKRILKRAFATTLPSSVLERPKAGFNAPLAHWLRGDLRSLAEDVLLSKRTRELGLFHVSEVETLLRDLTRGFRDHSLKLWGLLNLVLWLDVIVASRHRQPPAAPLTRAGRSAR